MPLSNELQLPDGALAFITAHLIKVLIIMVYMAISSKSWKKERREVKRHGRVGRDLLDRHVSLPGPTFSLHHGNIKIPAVIPTYLTREFDTYSNNGFVPADNSLRTLSIGRG